MEGGEKHEQLVVANNAVANMTAAAKVRWEQYHAYMRSSLKKTTCSFRTLGEFAEDGIVEENIPGTPSIIYIIFVVLL